MPPTDYDEEKGMFDVRWVTSISRSPSHVRGVDKIKRFLTEFYSEGDEGKVFTYAEQLVNIAHREQVELTIDLEDVAEVRRCLTAAS